MPPRRKFVAFALTAASVFALTGPAVAASPPVSDPHILAHFNFAKGQTAENIALEPDGSADESFALAAQTAHVSREGEVTILAQLPSSPSTTCSYVNTHAITTGLVRDHRGALYTALCTGSADLQGIWRVGRDGTSTRVAALPPTSFPNGIAFDRSQRFIYVADSLLSTVWRVSVADGTVTAWATGPELAPDGYLGANGLKVHDGAVYVSNTKHGTLLRIPIGPDGSAGPIATAASGLFGIDDFAFTGPEPEAFVFAAIHTASEVALVRADGTSKIVLTAADGLSNPTSIAIRGRTLYVNSGAFTTAKDPNLLLARLER